MVKKGSEGVYSFSNEEKILSQDKAIKDKLLSRILLAESEIKEGKFTDVNEFIAHIFRHFQD